MIKWGTRTNFTGDCRASSPTLTSGLCLSCLFILCTHYTALARMGSDSNMGTYHVAAPLGASLAATSEQPVRLLVLAHSTLSCMLLSMSYETDR